MYVIDAFCYNGEPIATKRIAYSFEHVDYFIIVEAHSTHAGARKDALYFDTNFQDFAPFMTKIIFYAIDSFPPMPSEWPEQNKHHTWMNGNFEAWWRESYQRNMCKRVLMDEFHNKRFVLICSDCDEIVKDTVLDHLHDDTMYEKCNELIFLEMEFFYYSTKWIKPYSWYKAFIINDKALKSLPDLTHCRVNSPVSRVISKAGWHFSYFMDTVGLQNKLSSFAHRECDKKEFADLQHINKCILEGDDLFNRGAHEKLQLTPPSALDNIPDLFKGETN